MIKLEDLPSADFKQFILDIARKNNVTYVKTAKDTLAETITNLSDDEVKMDEVEHLIIALERAGVLDSEAVVTLHVYYLREKYDDNAS
jgi:hypothetical protein